jgi:thymidylate synthase
MKGARPTLNQQVYIRSNDMFLGAPFNIASYALLQHMIAQVVDMGVGDLVMTIGDAHIYLDHIEQVKEQLSRTPFDPPKLWLNPDIKDIDHFQMDDIEMVDYVSHPPIKATMSA